MCNELFGDVPVVNEILLLFHTLIIHRIVTLLPMYIDYKTSLTPEIDIDLTYLFVIKIFLKSTSQLLT